MRPWIPLLLLTACATPAVAGVTVSPLAPDAALVSGSDAVVEVLARADGDGGLPPDAVRALWTAPGREVSVTARRRGDIDALLSGTVAVAEYVVPVPERLSGDVVLAFEGGAGRVLVTVVEPVADGGTPVPTPAEARAERLRALAEFNWLRPFYAHEPLYFIFGVHEEVDARFQLSFKYRITGVDDLVDKSTADAWLAPDGLYFGYTQTSLWDIAEGSSPFRDTSYRPSLFWQERDAYRLPFAGGGEFRASFQAGFEHESNGRDVPQSRSINVLFVRPYFGWFTPGGWRFLVSPRVNAFLEKDENEDLDEYRGFVDLLVSLRAPEDGLQVTLLGRKGTRSGYGSIQADVTYPAGFLGLPGYFQVQAFHGWGETLLDYRERTDLQLRVGFSAIR